MIVTRFTVGVAVLFAAIASRADIYEWRDADGNRHFTNNMVNVPEGNQSSAKVIVTGVPSSPSPELAHVPAVSAEAPQQPVVIYDNPQRPDAYAEGLRDGVVMAHLLAQSGGGGVYIQGPLAVANASPSLGYSPWLYPPYYPLVTTSFDRGRSRHMTLRMLLQDQFQLDRDGPFWVDRALPGNGPNLRPFLPRGLPHDVGLDAGGPRVITR
jgi:hypothetical protein